MKRYLILVIALIMVISTAGCTSFPGSNHAGPVRYHFHMTWESNSSYNVPLSSFNLSDASISNLIYAKIHAKLIMNNRTENNTAIISISNDKLHLDFVATYSMNYDDADMIKNDKVYDFSLTMEIESQDPAVSGMKLIGENNNIQGNFTMHNYDMEHFGFNITTPSNYKYDRMDSRARWGEVKIDLRSGHLLKFDLGVLVY